jgi:anti-sigma factor RsiW
MCNKDDLVSYLYDDLSNVARAAFERHLRACAECREELTAMRGVRADLLTWSPPEPDFAFRIVKEPRATNDPRAAHAANVLRPDVPSWRGWFRPAAGFAAAAVLVLAAAAGLARVEVRKDADGWTMRTGASAAVADGVVAGFGGFRAHDVHLTSASGDDVMASLERRIAALETAASRETSNVRYASLQSARASNDEILKVVRDLLAQSESNQKRELAIRMAQLIRDLDSQRVADLNRMQAGIRSIDQNVAADAAQHREMVNIMLATNSKQK